MQSDFSSGKVVLITGATDGIGKETARILAEQGAKVIIHGRDKKKGLAVKQEISRIAQIEPEILIADFTSLEQVRYLASEVRRKFPKLQILINNAGVYSDRKKLTQDGFEQTFQVQYLAPFLVTNLLLDTLKANAPSRIINVTSRLHEAADLDFDNLQGEMYYEGQAAYCTSKLALTMFTLELSDRLKDSGVTVNCLHPGAVNTKLLRAGFGAGGISVQEGAEIPVYLASSPNLERVTGKYFNREAIAEPDPRANDLDLRRRLWNFTKLLLKEESAEAKAAS